VLFFLVVFSLVGLPACSSSKVVAKPKEPKLVLDNSLIGQGQDDVKKKFGEPADVCKTAEGNLLWIYKPPWKVMPNDKGTLYVEFHDGKVTKVFKKQ
jgi:hypothetical protein